MARMVPTAVDPATPASERRVFEALRTAAESGGWTVLHSLGLSSSWAGEYGEIDFVVLIPGRGIVCVEVKGGGVSVTDGVWTTRNRRGVVEKLKKSPYRQAQDGQWKLLAALRAKFGDGSIEARCRVGWLVVFPDVTRPPLTPEATREEVIDREDLEADISQRISSAPSLRRLETRQDLAAPNAGICARILAFLRPDFEMAPTRVSHFRDVETRLLKLTEEQFDALDGVAENASCLLLGSAGTGKTLLGVESTRREAAQGRNVLLTCFNAPLGRWLSAAVEGFGPGRVVAGHVHGILRDRIMQSAFADDLASAERAGMSGDELYQRLYFELGELAVEDGDERFDLIVVDEAQDLPAQGLATLLGAWRRPGDAARILLLGDFTRQAIYGGTASTSVAALSERLAPLALYRLRQNCRNTRRIAHQTGILTGLGNQKVSDRQPEGDPVSVHFHGDRSAGVAQLDTIVRRLREEGFKASDAVLLGSRRRENSLIAGLDAVGGWTLGSLLDTNGGRLAYSTAHAFKGLERRVVIVVDAEADTSEGSDSLLYVAMSRAVLRLFILAPDAMRPALERRMTIAALAAAGGTAP